MRFGEVEAKRATRTRIVEEGHFRGQVVYLIESEPAAPGERCAPQAFLAEQAPNWSFVPHFHLQDEFQVIVAGAGDLAGSALSPIMVHYASRETIYGPLRADSSGLSYLTIRGITDSGIWPLADARKMATPGLKRFQTHSSAAPLAGPGRIETHDRQSLIADLPAGASSVLERLPAGYAISAGASAGDAGLFVVTLSGSATLVDTRVQSLGVAHLMAQELPVAIVAGPQGAEILLLQFNQREGEQG